MALYPYTILPGSEFSVAKPLIPVSISYPKTHKVIPYTFALVDSGADVNFCDMNIGTWLGINFRKKKSQEYTAANGQNFIAFSETVCLQVFDKKFLCLFNFSDELTKAYKIILGQKGFFDHFKITFNLPNKSMEFK